MTINVASRATILQNTAYGKILQVVRATDGTERTTTSTSLVDASLSATITPQLASSNILIICTYPRAISSSTTASNLVGTLVVTDSSDNLVSGNAAFGPLGFNYTGFADFYQVVTIIGRATPATTSAVTYKTRFASGNAATTLTLQNQFGAGQLWLFEVSA
jgi:hypothetical protein